MSKFKYTKENPLRVFTAFSGYDSQCMALDRIGIPYELVDGRKLTSMPSRVTMRYIRSMPTGTTEISPRSNGMRFQTLTSSPTVSLVRISAMPDSRKDCKRVREHDHPSCGNVARLSRPRSLSIC